MTENQLEAEIQLFRQYRPELEEKIRSGKLRYVVEWWEDDCLDIDENVHVFFQFEGDGEYKWEFEAHWPILRFWKSPVIGQMIFRSPYISDKEVCNGFSRGMPHPSNRWLIGTLNLGQLVS